MKFNKIFAAMMAVAVLAMFGSCKNEGTDVIKLKGSKITLTVGQSYTIGVQEHSGDITWASSNAQVATVDANGTVTAVAVGNAAVTATVGKATATMDVTVEEGGQTGGIPDLEAPEDGYVTFVINIPAGSECNGIAFKGTRNANWTDCSGENTYVGADAENLSADQCIKFEPIADAENWYKATYKLGVEPWGDDAILLAGKICLIYSNDASWDGQAVDWEYYENYTTAVHSISNDGNIQVSSTGLVYVIIGGWNKSECEVLVEQDYNIVVKVPSCADVTPEIVGDFDGWAGTALTKDGDVWKATIHATEKDKIKVREAGDTNWTNQIQVLNAETGEWNDAPDSFLSKETDVTLDFSDGEKYRWTVCGGPVEPVEPTGEVWIKCAANGWSWEQMTEANGVFTYEATVTDATNVGANINIVAEDGGAIWYDLGDMSAAAHGLAEGDAYVYTFTQTDGATGTLEVAKK